MRLNELFNDDINIELIPSETDLIDANILPGHINIPGEKEVSLVKDADIILKTSWDELKKYLRINYKDLNGTYQVASEGSVIYSFSVSQ